MTDVVRLLFLLTGKYFFPSFLLLFLSDIRSEAIRIFIVLAARSSFSSQINDVDDWQRFRLILMLENSHAFTDTIRAEANSFQYSAGMWPYGWLGM